MTEWNASAYNKEGTLQKELAEKQLARLTLNGSEHILDVGCGDGKITAEIAARVPKGSVLGVDPSSEMIAFATKHFGPPNIKNLRFEVANVRKLTFQNQFDLVVSFNALHWVPEQPQALNSIRAALKPTGRAVLRFVPQGKRTCLEDVIEQTRKSDRWSEFFNDFRCPYAHFTPEEYRKLAEQAGFSVVELHLEEGAWDFKTRDGFVAFARATFAEWTKRLPETEWDAFITDVLDRYQKLTANNAQELHTFKYYQLEVVLAVAG